MNAGTAERATSGIDADAKRARALLESGEFAAALAVAQALHAAAPEHRDALYMIAVCQRFLKRVPEALAALEELEHRHPQFSRLFQERGYCHVAQRDAPRAVQAFEHAVRLNSALPGSWK